MTTIKSEKTKRTYEVRSKTYGTANTIHSLWYGGIWCADTNRKTLQDAIDDADKFVEKHNISSEMSKEEEQDYYPDGSIKPNTEDFGDRADRLYEHKRDNQ